MDLKNLDIVSLANSGGILELLHPATGEVLTDEKGKNPKAFYLRLLGNDSDTYRNSIKRRFEKSQNQKKKKIDIDDAQLKGAELMAKCTTECYIVENGNSVECTRSEMIRCYLKYPWMREQAEEYMGERSNLFKS